MWEASTQKILGTYRKCGKCGLYFKIGKYEKKVLAFCFYILLIGKIVEFIINE